MHCERVQENFLDWETLPPELAAECRAHLENCPTCQREFAAFRETLRQLDALPSASPSAQLREKFYAMLEAEGAAGVNHSAAAFSNSRRIGRTPWYFGWELGAAAALLLGGIAFGYSLGRNAVSTSPQLLDTQRQVAELRAKVETMNQVVSYSLAPRAPASQRLQQVVAKAGQDDDAALTQLLSAMAFDSSTNVRLSALESLYARANERVVREGVLAALPRESSPLVQVAMIDFLTSIHEPEAAAVLQDLERTPTTHEAVRAAAQRALAQF